MSPVRYLRRYKIVRPPLCRRHRQHWHHHETQARVCGTHTRTHNRVLKVSQPYPAFFMTAAMETSVLRSGEYAPSLPRIVQCPIKRQIDKDANHNQAKVRIRTRLRRGQNWVQ